MNGASHSTEVELLGAMWAAIYAQHLPWEEQVYIVCDTLAAVDKASNRVRLVSDLDKLAATVLKDVQRVRPIKVIQEPGHQGFPRNEAVGSISRHLTQESNVPPALPEGPVRVLSYTVYTEWQFARLLGPSTSPCPRFINDGFRFNVSKQK
eukprot:3277818-Pyramimonas_sp.AAC.1